MDDIILLVVSSTLLDHGSLYIEAAMVTNTSFYNGEGRLVIEKE